MKSSIGRSLKSLVAFATLTVMGQTEAAHADLHAKSQSQKPVDIEMAYKEAAQGNNSNLYQLKPVDTDTLGQRSNDIFTIPDVDTLSMQYAVDPSIISEYAKQGVYPLPDGRVSVLEVSDKIDNSPQHFFHYMSLNFSSGIKQRNDGSSYKGLAHVHVAIAVDPTDPASMQKMSKLNEALQEQIIGVDGAVGWAAKYGVMIDGIIPMYLDKGQMSHAHSYPALGVKDLILEDGGMMCVINNQNTLLAADGQCLKDIDDLTIFMDGMFARGAHLMTKEEYKNKGYSILDSDLSKPNPSEGATGTEVPANEGVASDQSGRGDAQGSSAQNFPVFDV